MWGLLPDQSPFHSAPFAEGLLCAQPQAAGKMDVTLCCLLVTLLVLVGLGGPIVRGSQGGFHEQVDLGLELGAKEVRQVTRGLLRSTCLFTAQLGRVLSRPTKALASQIRTICVAFTVYTLVMPFYRW